MSALICIFPPSFTAFSVRLFSVLRYEVMIHEFDPYFNYRTTKYLAEEGFYKFHNWFDDRAWYPLGRIIGKKCFYFLWKMKICTYVSHSIYQPVNECESLNINVFHRKWIVLNQKNWKNQNPGSSFGSTRYYRTVNQIQFFTKLQRAQP